MLVYMFTHSSRVVSRLTEQKTVRDLICCSVNCLAETRDSETQRKRVAAQIEN